EGVLKGVPFDRKLVTTTYDGIAIQPLYTADNPVPAPGLPGSPPFVRGSSARGQIGGWDVRQYVAEPDARAANDAVLAGLERGATSIWVRVGDGGVTPAGLADALAGVYLDAAAIELDPVTDPVAAVDALEAVWRALPPSETHGCLGLDPL